MTRRNELKYSFKYCYTAYQKYLRKTCILHRRSATNISFTAHLVVKPQYINIYFSEVVPQCYGNTTSEGCISKRELLLKMDPLPCSSHDIYLSLLVTL